MNMFTRKTKVWILVELIFAAGVWLLILLTPEQAEEREQTAAPEEDNRLPAPAVVPVPEASPAPYGLVNIRHIHPAVCIDLKYASTDNFTGKTLYDNWDACLQKDVAEMLSAAGSYLRTVRPDLRLLIYDAARPLSVQRRMWEHVRDTPYSRYVAHPERTGLHNYGAAVDLTLSDSLQTPLDMGTDFDYFGEAAGINREDELVARGILTARQAANRQLLRKVMLHAGFRTISGEWWHFNACTLSEAKERYPLIK
ncbi:MAG: M15 family metallopeptidase [Bacteroidales bacterium]|nr:M15 family metallopeptidase [Bacteroidales bacterium]